MVMANGAGRHMRSATTRRPEGVRLADVLSMADHLRQLLPGRREVEEAVRRLTGAGLITVADGWFRVTSAGGTLWRARRSGVGAVDTVYAQLLRRPIPDDSDWTLDDADHAAAILEYAGRTEPAD
ncbi:hypothetical protein Ais01nite_60700 [Asanoa ishikariensis]|nr:hypothetical protein Ais01nite_60700 [Asanoa ishikariensis]